MTSCGGWLMTAISILIVTTVALGGAAAFKYLFLTRTS